MPFLTCIFTPPQIEGDARIVGAIDVCKCQTNRADARAEVKWRTPLAGDACIREDLGVHGRFRAATDCGK
jgi:hypothetical protein